MDDQERANRTKEFHESKKPLKQRMVEGLGLEYHFDSDSYSVRDVRFTSHLITDMHYMECRLSNHPDLMEKAEAIWEKAQQERPISFMFGKV